MLSGKKILSILLLAAVLLSAAPMVALAQDNGYDLSVSVDGWTLSMNSENLSLMIEDGRGNVFYSGRRHSEEDGLNNTWSLFLSDGVTVGFKDAQNRTSQRSLTKLDPRITITALSNGFKAKVRLGAIGLSFTMYITLSGGRLDVSIPASELSESNPEMFGVMYMIIYPFMNASYGLCDGIILVPDGSGALIDLSQKTLSVRPYSRRVYGDDTGIFGDNGILKTASAGSVASVMMPVYGITQNGRGVFTAITDGAEYAEINASVFGITTNYNYAHAKFYFREQYYKYYNRKGDGSNSITQERYEYDIALSFSLFSEGDALSRMASAYRELLRERGTLENKRSGGTKLRLQYLISENKPNIFGNHELSCTTYQDIMADLRYYQSVGITGIQVSLLGYQRGGLSNASYRRFALSRKAGTAAELRELCDLARKLGGSVSFAFDYATAYTDARGIRNHNLAMSISNQVIYALSEENYALTGNLRAYRTLGLEKITDKLTADTAALTELLGYAALDIADMSNTLNSSHYRYVASRQQVRDDYTALLGGSNAALMLASPNEYMWRLCGAMTDIETGSSRFIITTEDVPFLQMVCSGSLDIYSKPVNLDYNDRATLLTLIDYNIYPSFLLTGCDSVELINTNSSYIFSSNSLVWRSFITEIYGELNEALSRVAGAAAVARVKLADGVYKTTYDNGVSVTVNYSSLDYIGDAAVSACGYAVTNDE